MKARVILGAFLGTAFLACGGLGEVDQPRTLATLEGQLTETQSVKTAAATRIAVLWANEDIHSFMTTQDVPASPVFPSKFKIELTAPPPPAVLIGYTRSSTPTLPGGIAIGALVAYEDLNGNGKLDLIETEPAFIDHALGVNRDLYLAYVEGSSLPPEIAAKDGSKPSPGYNLLRRKVCPPEPAFAEDGPVVDCDQDILQWLPMTTLYDLPLSGAPEFQTAMCRKGVNYITERGERVPSPPAPADAWPGQYGGQNSYPDLPPDPWAKTSENAKVTCSPNGSALNYTECTFESHNLCDRRLTRCEGGLYFRPEVPPATWPCPAK